MPESDLRAFLRVFMSEERIEASLDSIALMGLEIEATDPLELFVLAHMEVDEDPRVTIEAEAVVLMEEVGLDVDQVAAILGMEADAVTQAVEAAWADSGDPHPDPQPDPDPDPPADPQDVHSVPDAEPSAQIPEEEGSPQEGAQDVHLVPDAEPSAQVPEEEGSPEEGAEPEPEADPPAVAVVPRRPVGLMVGGVVVLVAIVALAIPVFSPEGRLRVQAQGMDPVLALAVLALLLLGGWSFLRASAPDTVDEKPLDVEPEPDGVGPTAAEEGTAVSGAGPSAGPADPSS